jgi:DNA polymerase I-like protein with 3'-5' exonuclease and polymerase domains
VEYRQLFAAQATYIKSLQTACVETRSSTSVFPTFDYHTSTGRLKCLRPNLQGLPDCVASSALGCVANLRKCIVSSPDSVLLSVDYYQIELRLAAHLSKDPLLCQLLTAGGDVLLLVATVWTGKSIEDITADDRQRTKQIVYGIMYGVSCHEAASMTGMAMQEAMRVIEVFKHSFKGLTSFSDAMVSFCRKTGYVETFFGRRRYLPNINSSNVKDKRRAERQAVNSAIQGSGADLIKIAMEATRNQLRAASLGSMCRLVMQIHDELVFEVNQDVIASVATIVQRVMTRCVTLSVPLLVKMAVGRSWGDLTPYSPP